MLVGSHTRNPFIYFSLRQHSTRFIRFSCKPLNQTKTQFSTVWKTITFNELRNYESFQREVFLMK